MKFVKVIPGISTATFRGGETVIGESSQGVDVMLDEFSQVMSELTSTVRQIGEAVKPLSGESGKEISEIISSIKQTVARAAMLVGETEGAVRRVSPKIEDAVNELKTRLEELGKLTDKETTAEIKQAVKRLNNSLGYLEKFLGTRIK
jgi:methyl-accepting chemotaxis protein